MALEARVNSRGSMCVPVDYIVYIQEIKPWPPSHSLRSICSVFLQWNNIDRCSGSTRIVIPSIGPGVGDGKIKFNESFKLPVTLSLEASMKGADGETFKNNNLEFNLYGYQAGKTDKDQLLGTVALDLMEYADLKKTVSVNAPLNFKRGLRTTTQPVLSIKIQPMNKNNAFFSSRNRPAKEASLNKDEGKLMNGVYLEESDLSSFTDVDACIHFSLTTSSSFEATAGLPLEERESEEVKGSAGRGSNRESLPQEPAKQEVKIAGHKLLNEISSLSSSIDLSSDVSSPEKYNISIPNNHETRSTSIGYDGTDADLISTNSKRCLDRADLVRQVHEKIVRRRSKFKENAQQFVEDNSTNTVIPKFASSEAHFDAVELFAYSDIIGRQKENRSMPEVDGNGLTIKTDHVVGDGDRQQQKGQEEQREKENHSIEELNQFSTDATGKPLTSSRDTGHEGRFKETGKLMNNSSRQANPVSNAFEGNVPCKEEIKEVDIVVDTCTGAKNAQNVSREGKKGFYDGKIQQLKFKTEKLERELREAAAIEMSLYSMIAEHGSSASKLYAPARRLARLYSHACKHGAAAGKASTAKSVVSGLSLVAKACGKDVSRLTFWLSNSIVLRASINETDGNMMQSQIISALQTNINGSVKSNCKESSSLKQKVMSSGKKGKECGFTDNFDSWEDPKTFTTALEKIESWIYSRTIHAVWCQVFSPCMQSSPLLSRPNKVLRRKQNRSKPSLGDQEQADFSFELWKNAFQDAYDTLCPVRAGGYDCACLPILARMIMEQCLSRLDVAMFNTLFHEAVDDTIADPESARICDSKVLPISVGKTSFGIGAQLKHVIGKWSRWLTDLIGNINYDADSKADEYKCVNDRKQKLETHYEFHLLNSLSNLLMLPKDMLFNKSFREEVCPTFSAPLIKRILNNFVPDEFCPEQIPEALFEALDSEDLKVDENIIRWIPCKAAPIAYLPPAAASLASILSELRINKSLVFQKSCTSDDDLDEADSPHSSIIFDSNSLSFGKRKENEVESLIRYQLLWEVWRDGKY